MGNQSLYKSEMWFSVSIAGITCNFHTNCERIAFHLKELLKYHLIDAPSEQASVHEIAVVLSESIEESSHQEGRESWKGKISDGTTVFLAKLEEDCFKLWVGDDVEITMNMKKGQSICKIIETPVADGRRHPEPSGYFIPFFQILLSYFDLYVIHASAVAFEGKSMLLMGQSGSGKTTMSLVLAKAGIDFMGDDLIVIESQNKEVISHALLFKPKIEFTPGKGKVSKDCINEYHLKICHKATLSRLLFLQRSKNGSYGFEDISPVQVLHGLLSQGNNFRFIWHPQNWFDTASVIAQNIPGQMWIIGPPGNIDIQSIKEILN